MSGRCRGALGRLSSDRLRNSRRNQGGWVWTIQESIIGHALNFIHCLAVVPWAMIYEVAESIEALITDCCMLYLANKAPERYAASIKRLIAHVDSIEKTRQPHAKLRQAEKSTKAMIQTDVPWKTSLSGIFTTDIFPGAAYAVVGREK
ncbi:hypothetical protein V8C44DRAFT_343830 [Trichoderma aethiopicum]